MSVRASVSDMSQLSITDKSIAWSPLHQAVHYLSLTDCKILIETEKYDVNLRISDGRTPLMLLCNDQSKNYDKICELAKYLFRMGADPNIEDKKRNKPLQRAVKSRNYLLIKLLIECGANEIDLSDEAEWLLYEATKRKELVKLFDRF
ncbi:unnamed protein product [Cercopithifilaria johnstoni]|uniref:Ankyrin repeat protein n=1 Tax=Cercopithifilaria johnstoni TaxID=2874296 RepID=A0A8J2MFL4_9BILA|nr:unnamed protein product [Cercopithifilaria johnstoni]